jgi:PAS domain S-box-containing protein
MKRARGKMKREKAGDAPRAVASKADDYLSGMGDPFLRWEHLLHTQTGCEPVKRADGGPSLFSGHAGELIRNLPVGIALIRTHDPDDVRTWRIAAANSIAKRIIGESLIDFLLTRVAKSFPFHQKMEDIYEGILCRCGSRDLHWLICEVGGIRRTYSVTGFAVPPNHLGLLMQDVTAHTEVRKSLLENKNRYAEISQAIETFFWKADPETLQTKWVSSEAQKVLGYWPEHWTHMPNFWLDHTDPQDRDVVQRLVRSDAATDGARFDYRMKGADGRTVWLHAVVHQSENLMGQQELTGVMVDITARKLAEEAAHELSGRLLRLQDEERRHVARDLHDSLGQYISVLGMNIGTLARSVRGLTEDQTRVFAETMELLETCLREVRTVSYLMHPPMLDEVGLVPALEWYASGFSERSHIHVVVDAPRTEARLPNLVETAFFRITQEALTNIYRHSRSKTATIRLRDHAAGITLEVADSGTGLDDQALEGIASGNGSARGVGIRGMRERMRELEGTLKIVSNKNGTSLCAHVPRTSSIFAEKSEAATSRGRKPENTV